MQRTYIHVLSLALLPDTCIILHSSFVLSHGILNMYTYIHTYIHIICTSTCGILDLLLHTGLTDAEIDLAIKQYSSSSSSSSPHAPLTPPGRPQLAVVPQHHHGSTSWGKYLFGGVVVGGVVWMVVHFVKVSWMSVCVVPRIAAYSTGSYIAED